jgi:hypothetical protein
MTNLPEPILFLSDARGIYIPRDFAQGIKRECVSGVTDEDWKILEAGPDHEAYWETWNLVCDYAVITDEHGIRYRPYQNGDCWLVPEGMEYDERTEGFKWPDDEDEDEEVVEPEDQDEGSLGDDTEKDVP